MCNSLRLSWETKKNPLTPTDIRVGGEITNVLVRDATTFPVTWKEEKGPFQWQGHAREESLDQWIAKGWTRAKVHVEGFTEGKRFFDMAGDELIQGLVLKTPERNIFRTITREAYGQEAEVHNRWPLLEVKK